MPTKIISLLLGTAIWCAPINAAAQTVMGPGVGLQLGYHADYRRASLIYETPSLWQHQFDNRWGKLDLHVAFGLSYWHSKRYDSRSMGQLGAIPMLRWWPNEQLF